MPRIPTSWWSRWGPPASRASPVLIWPRANVNIIKSVMPQVIQYAPHAVYVVVSNPVDILTYAILKVTGLPVNQVIGSGTTLDSSRLRARIADIVGLTPQNVHAYVFGEHGDSAMIPWSLTSIAGMPMTTFCEQVQPGTAFLQPGGAQGHRGRGAQLRS